MVALFGTYRRKFTMYISLKIMFVNIISGLMRFISFSLRDSIAHSPCFVDISSSMKPFVFESVTNSGVSFRCHFQSLSKEVLFTCHSPSVSQYGINT